MLEKCRGGAGEVQSAGNVLGEVLEKCGRSAGEVMERCWRSAGQVQEMWWKGAGEVLDRCRKCAGEMMDRCWGGAGEVQESSWRGAVEVQESRKHQAEHTKHKPNIFQQMAGSLLMSLPNEGSLERSRQKNEKVGSPTKTHATHTN